MAGLTDSDIAAAYPYFYGQVVFARETPPTEPGGKTRLNTGFKPYAQFLDNEVTDISVGASATNTLTGENAANIWTVTSLNSGSISSFKTPRIISIL